MVDGSEGPGEFILQGLLNAVFSLGGQLSEAGRDILSLGSYLCSDCHLLSQVLHCYIGEFQGPGF